MDPCSDVAEAQAHAADGTAMDLHITALGGSVPTPDDGWIEGPLLVVRHLDALDTLDARGHIVLFNRPMDPLLINTGAAYGGAFDQRGRGASAAAEAGAIGVLVRSLTHALDTLPYTRGRCATKKAWRSCPQPPSPPSMRPRWPNSIARPLVPSNQNAHEQPRPGHGGAKRVVGEWRGSEFPDGNHHVGQPRLVGHRRRRPRRRVRRGARWEALRAQPSRWVHPAQGPCGSCSSSTKKTGTAAASATPQWRLKNTP